MFFIGKYNRRFSFFLIFILISAGCATYMPLLGNEPPGSAVANARASIREARNLDAAINAPFEMERAEAAFHEAQSMWSKYERRSGFTGNSILDNRIKEKALYAKLYGQLAIALSNQKDIVRELTNIDVEYKKNKLLKQQYQAEQNRLDALIAQKRKFEEERRMAELKAAQAAKLQAETQKFIEMAQKAKEEAARQLKMLEDAKAAAFAAQLKARQAQKDKQELETLKRQLLIAKEMARQAQEHSAKAQREAQFNQAQAKNAQELADKAKAEALLQKEIADATRAEALNIKEQADKTKAEALLQKEMADAAKQEALSIKEQADKAKAEAAFEKKQAQEARLKALQEAARAKKQMLELENKLGQLSSEFAKVKQEKRGLVVTLSDILFDVDKSTIRMGTATKLNHLVNILKDYPKRKILIEGHTDNTGTDEYNLILSKERAYAVMGYLLSKGLNEQKIQAKGFGEIRPVATNYTPEGRQQNRRVEIVILNPKNYQSESLAMTP